MTTMIAQLRNDKNGSKGKDTDVWHVCVRTLESKLNYLLMEVCVSVLQMHLNIEHDVFNAVAKLMCMLIFVWGRIYMRDV